MKKLASFICLIMAFNLTTAQIKTVTTPGGTSGKLMRFTGSSTAGNSLVYDNGTSVSIGNASPTASTLFELNSTTGALLFPRMTTTEKLALTPIAGMVLYDNTIPAYSGYIGGAWYSFVGNAGTTTANQYVKSSASNIIADALLKDSTDYVTTGSSGFTTRRFKFVDGNQGSAKVLTSDANGQASWAAAASTLAGATGDLISFSATNTASNIAAVATGYLFGSAGTSTLPTWLQAAVLNTSLRTPLLIGGTGTTDDLSFRTTSGAGTTGADFIWQSGNNGGTELMRLVNAGSLLIGGSTQLVAGSLAEYQMNSNATLQYIAQNSSNGAAATTQMLIRNDLGASGNMSFGVASSGYTTAGMLTQGNAYIRTNTTGLSIGADNGAGVIRFYSGGNTERWRMDASGNLSNTGVAGTAYITLKAGTSAAGTSFLKMTSGPLLSSKEVGAWGFLTDKLYFTITTGTAEKEITLNDAALTSTYFPVATTNGRLTNSVMTTDGTSVSVASDLKLITAGNGIYIEEGSNATMGTATLSGGTITVNTTKVTANSRIFLTIESPGGTVGVPYVAGRTSSTSFDITSTSGTDTSVIAWIIIEPN